MDDNLFFKFVWRFNALAIAGAVVVGGLLAAYAALQIVLYETRERAVTNVVNVGGGDTVRDTFDLGSPSRMPGTEFIRVALYRSQSMDMGRYSKSSGGNAANFLFLNASTNLSAWMMPNANQLFLSDTILFDKISAPAAEPRAAVGLVFTVIERDTDGDKRLTSTDLVALTVSRPDGTGYRKIVDGIERLYSIEQIADDKVLALYRKGDATLSELYALPAMTLVSQKAVPKIDLK